MHINCVTRSVRMTGLFFLQQKEIKAKNKNFRSEHFTELSRPEKYTQQKEERTRGFLRSISVLQIKLLLCVIWMV